jgi:hypothetical protein
MPLVLALLCVVGAAASGLPPATARPKSAATSAASRQLVERAGAASRADAVDEAIALLRQAVAVEPAHHDARVTLAAVLLDQHPDEALVILTELRDAGCRTCLRAVTDFVWRMTGTPESASVRGRLEALAKDAHGRPTRVTRAADAVWRAFEHRDWAALAPHLGQRTKIEVTLTAADPAEKTASGLSPVEMRAWFDRQTTLHLHRDESWFCTDRCCEYWSWSPSRTDITNYLERICFDTSGPRARLTRLEWSQG